ncbi:MAG: DUF1844 domain-containing protein [Thermoguttaceae bacterium]|jgi:hypothetical protein
MPDDATNPEKRIIVDEDWKSRVEAEREAAGGGAEVSPAPEPPPDVPLPPPDLIYLASTLYLQGVIGLGLVPNPVSGKPEMQLTHAKHAIDTLDVLQKKTAGNRTPEESDQIEAMLHQLRLAYVELREQGPK